MTAKGKVLVCEFKIPMIKHILILFENSEKKVFYNLKDIQCIFYVQLFFFG